MNEQDKICTSHSEMQDEQIQELYTCGGFVDPIPFKPYDRSVTFGKYLFCRHFGLYHDPRNL
ncbi:hypothetical protein BLOT_006312 [Blomia tropicalis]|nr:hypothetical protein BLOT_006312 [Blomia tropicalis]